MNANFKQTSVRTTFLLPNVGLSSENPNLRCSPIRIPVLELITSSCSEKSLVELNKNIELLNTNHKYDLSFEFSKILINEFPDNAEVPSVDLDEDDGSIDIFWKNKTALLSAKIENNLLIYVGIFGEKRCQGQKSFDNNDKPQDFINLIKKYFARR